MLVWDYIFRYSEFVICNCGRGGAVLSRRHQFYFIFIHLIFIIFCVWRGSCFIMFMFAGYSDTPVYSAITPSVTISWTHHYSTQIWTWILLALLLCTLSVIFSPWPSLYPTSPPWLLQTLQLCLLILDFKTMGGVLSQLFSLALSRSFIRCRKVGL